MLEIDNLSEQGSSSWPESIDYLDVRAAVEKLPPAYAVLIAKCFGLDGVDRTVEQAARELRMSRPLLIYHRTKALKMLKELLMDDDVKRRKAEIDFVRMLFDGE